jgi:hypothetical protein
MKYEAEADIIAGMILAVVIIAFVFYSVGVS